MRALLAVGVCAAVLALGGCGGGGDSDSASTATTSASATTAPSATTQDSATAPRPSQQGAGGQEQAQGQKPKEGSATKQGAKGGGSAHATAVKVPPISSRPIAGTSAPAPGVKTVPGADDSVQTYGVESGASERSEATIALAAYLDARAAEDWQGACEALARRPSEELEKLAKSLSAQGKETSGCAGAMAALGEGSPGSQPPAATITEVLSLRTGGDVSGDPSYLIFSGPPANTLYSMPMYLQGGGWKVGLAVAAELPL